MSHEFTSLHSVSALSPRSEAVSHGRPHTQSLVCFSPCDSLSAADPSALSQCAIIQVELQWKDIILRLLTQLHGD